MSSDAKFPEPEGFEQTLDAYVPAVVDNIFKSFTESEDERVRAWAKEIGLDGLRQNMGRIVAFQVRSTAEQFYQVGYTHGAIKRITASGPGERSSIAYDDKGRIKQMVKTPLTVQEALDRERTGGKSG